MVEKTNTEINLFDTITSDLDKREIMMKQAQFNDLRDKIDKVLLGDISNFYRDDFRFKEEEEEKEYELDDLGNHAKAEEMDDFVANGAILATKQRKVVAAEEIKVGTII